MKEYYVLRATAGLIVAEISMIAPDTSWKEITDAIHANGGKVFVQLYHTGRVTHPVMNNGVIPLAPTAIAIDDVIHTPEGKLPFPTPQELNQNQIDDIVQQFVTASVNSVELAGFDGVDINAGNAFLIDQFLRDVRTNSLVVVNALSDATGSDRVAVHIAPLSGYNGNYDSDPAAYAAFIATLLNEFNLAFVFLLRHDLKGIMVFTKAEAVDALDNDEFGAIALGEPFVANPDLVIRFERDIDLNEPDRSTIYTQGYEGYLDYPTLD
ncbi:hypothetical protein THRCLA_11999 [Thraustotheca clavata]|uniref:NADH:flavin oxidoreductase/NADH oxidase N-terminal domain-containing protein n=1 Tax=Thraustotheca clavata TaxID=74557 RepID=A0A1V9Y477_9STRA|nr:hypothetical protein THRCLA_11999 [Thraustotheca clavata]